MIEPTTISDLILYRTDDGRERIEVRLQDETVWLSQADMANLFETSVPNINIHLKNIFSEGEVDEDATIKDYLIVRTEGSREVSRKLKLYNLQAVIAVGYRVRSRRGTQFRRWATERLREYLVKAPSAQTLPSRTWASPAGEAQRSARRTSPSPRTT